MRLPLVENNPCFLRSPLQALLKGNTIFSSHQFYVFGRSVAVKLQGHIQKYIDKGLEITWFVLLMMEIDFIHNQKVLKSTWFVAI